VLYAEVSGTGPRLVLAHGFTQTCRSWSLFGELLDQHHETVRVDLPGHGASADVRADLVGAGALLAETGGDAPVDLLGYSLGARVALRAALDHPEKVARLVLIGGTAGIDDPEARAERRRRDDALADEAERDVVGFLERWVRAPMFAGLRDPGLDARRVNTAGGLASSLLLAGVGTQAPLWQRLGEVRCPVLAIAGADDVRFVIAGRRLVAGVRDGVLSLVPGAGHAAHLVQPAWTARLVDAFFG
jgi:2-succinyl-6-hydroxy-2,4-cyclohexadiene-1-carboxylate synthase